VNACKLLLAELGESADDYEGICTELVDQTLHFMDRRGDTGHHLMWVDAKGAEEQVFYVPGGGKRGRFWDHHAAVLTADDMVHDAWRTDDDPVPLDTYLRESFPAQLVALMVDGHEFRVVDTSEPEQRTTEVPT